MHNQHGFDGDSYLDDSREHVPRKSRKLRLGYQHHFENNNSDESTPEQ